MGLSVEVDPTLTSLLTALGLLDADGNLDGAWFSHPLESLSTCLSNPTQRAALLRLLDEALPPQPHPLAPTGASWHPLLPDNDIGNAYLAVHGDLIGVTLVAGTPPGLFPDTAIGVQVVVDLPLVDVGGPEVVAVAASPGHPLDIGVVATLADPNAPAAGLAGIAPDVVGIRVAIDTTGAVRARIRLEDAGDAVEIDPTRLDGEVLDAVALLVRSVLAGVGDALLDQGLDPDVAAVLQRLAHHLFGIVGAGDDLLPELPLAQAVATPSALRTWFTGIVAEPAQLAAWFTHVAGLVGALPLDAVDPTVTGTGDAAAPLRATLVRLGPDITVDLLVRVVGDPANPANRALNVGVAITAPAGPATRGAALTATVDLLSVSLTGAGTPVVPVPAADVALTVPVSAVTGTDLGRISAGARWDGAQVTPTLRLDDVPVGGKRYTLDLSSAQAIADTGAQVAGAALAEALGDDGTALHALALLGLATPDAPGTPGTPGTPIAGWPALDVAGLLTDGDVARTIAQFHRRILADPTLSWGTLLRELGGLLGLTGDPAFAVTGTGVRATPWALTLVADDGLDLALTAWDDAPSGPDRRLRLGLRGSAAEGIWRASWTTELAAFDLPADAAGTSRFLGSHRLAVTLTDVPLIGDPAAGEPWLDADAIDVAVTWAPGTLPDLRVEVTGLTLGIGPDSTPPTSLVLPPADGLDLDAPDLGIGIDPDVVPALVRLALGAALRAFGQPTDWLVLLPDTTAGLAQALRDPVTALRERAAAVALTPTADGTPLVAALLGRLAAALGGVTSPTGAGTDDDPWAIPIVGGDDAPAVCALVWVEPTAGAAGTTPGTTPADALDDLLVGRRRVWLDSGLADLAAVLTAGDGLVPYAAATAGPHPAGTPIPCGHHALPGHPSTITQVQAQVGAWGCGPVVLIGAATGPGLRGWDPLVAALDPGHDPDADTLGAPALAYPVALDDDGSGDVAGLAAQVDAAVDRVRTLTGGAPVTLVGHGIAGLAARVSAERRPATVRGVVTLGTVTGVPAAPAEPGDPADPDPGHAASAAAVEVAAAVTRPEIADAVRVAAALLRASGLGTPASGAVDHAATAEAVDHLAAVLDGGPAVSGVLPPAGAASAAGLGVPPAGLTAVVPGLALGGSLDGTTGSTSVKPLSALLAPLLPDPDAPRATAAPTGPTTGPTAGPTTGPTAGPTTGQGPRFGLGVRVVLPLPAIDLGSAGPSEPGEPVQADLTLRADLTGTPTLHASLALHRDHSGWPTPWLVGDDGTRPQTRRDARCRRAELGVRLEKTASGIGATPVVVLHEAALGGARTARLGLADLVPLLTEAIGATGTSPLPPALRAAAEPLLGLVTALNSTPATALAALARGAVGTLADALGATGTSGGWTLQLAPGLALDVTHSPWTIRLHTNLDTGTDADGSAADAFRAGLDVDLAVTLPAWTTTASAALTLGSDTGGLRLTGRAGPAPALELSLPPWVPPISLLPGVTSADDASAAVLDALPRALLTGLLAPALGDVLAGRLAAAPLDTLLTDPTRWVGALDGPAIGGLLDALGAALDRPAPAAPGSIVLPGGLTLAATGTAGAPVEIRLTGALPLADGFTLTPDVGVRITVSGAGSGSGAGVTLAPLGGLAVTVPLPGTWGSIGIDLGIDTRAASAGAGALRLGVTPSIGTGTPGERIALLPTFGGLGALAAAAERLLPRVLQSLVDELTPTGGPAPGSVLDAALDVAAALGVYGRDADGFTRTDRADKLAAMLDPAWWESLVDDPAALTTAIGSILDALPLPLGDVDAAGSTVRWTVPLPADDGGLGGLGGLGGGTVDVELGWTPTKQPVITVGAHSVALGPLRLDEGRLGYDAGDLAARLVMHLDAGGVIAAVQPALVVDVVADLDGTGTTRFAVSVVPFGDGTQNELELRLAPTPEVVAGQGIEHAALLLVERWGVPLAIQVLVTAFDDVLDVPLWGPPLTTGPGPSAHDLLEAAGLLGDTLPDPGEALLRAFQRAASGVGIRVLDEPDGDGVLDLTLVSENVQVNGVDGVRTGVRLKGWVRIEASDGLTVTIRFGDAAWLTDGGITIWLIEPWPGGVLPLRPTAALDLIGIGADFGRADANLVQGTLVVGALGGLLFAEIDLFDDDNNPRVRVAGLGAGLAITDANIDISNEDADSFLRKVLPDSLAAPFDLTVVYRDDTLTFEGGDPSSPGRFELALALDIDLSIIRITELLLALQTSRGQTPAALEAALSGTASVGPIAAFVKRVGVIAVFGGDRPGLRLRAPDSVGLSIDTSQITLAGFVLVDEARGRYAGAIGIKLMGGFELAAVAIITTKMPDGSPGFSLLFLIAMKLPTPIALGYGFFFAGAGGLLGINRAVDLDRLRSGLRSGTADSILFPDPAQIVPRADQIIKDLEESFPIDPGNFLIGPMVLITWSTPPLITVKLGLIIQIGSPLRIAILGVLRASLPDAEDPILDLKVAFLGAIDVGAKLLSFDASIYDSFIGRGDFKLSFEGDIALRICWSDQPDFVTSIGGFHPRYHPPTHLHLPQMRRLRLSLLKDNPRLSLSCYFAITSNTVQFGARLDFYFEVASFSVEGDFGFDVLFQFSPFLLDAAVWARLAVKAGGKTLLSLSLDFSLVGPTPWIAKGTASFKVLFFTVKANFEKRFGEEALDSAPLTALVPIVTDELERAANWQSELPAGMTGSVTLFEITAGEGRVVIDAGGVVTFSQQVLPLDLVVTKFGTARPADASRFDVPQVWLGTTPGAPGARPADVEPVTAMFSPAAFADLGDDDKLAAPSFERRTSGVRLTAGSRLTASHATVRKTRHDLIVCDSADPASELPAPEQHVPDAPQPSADAFAALARGGAASRCAPARERRLAAQARTALAVDAPADLFAVVRVADLTPLEAGLSVADAHRRLADLAATEPGGAAALRVLPVADLPKGA